MKKDRIHRLLTYLIALVWVINGLACKVLNLVPRHEQIVSKILGDEYSSSLTVLIGFSEILMAIWILSRFRSKLNAITQIVIIVTMNILESYLAPELLLWGRMNFVFAILFCFLVFFNEFVLNKELTLET